MSLQNACCIRNKSLIFSVNIRMSQGHIRRNSLKHARPHTITHIHAHIHKHTLTWGGRVAGRPNLPEFSALPTGDLGGALKWSWCVVASCTRRSCMYQGPAGFRVRASSGME